MSRTVRLAGLGGVSIHPTPLYSILSCVVAGIILARLAWSRADAALIGGFYLILAGMSRFVEERFRGEPHTPVLAGLRLYQWCALTMVLLGLLVSSMPNAPVLAFRPQWNHALGVAGVVGIIYALAMGVDFPGSSRRFSRLT